MSHQLICIVTYLDEFVTVLDTSTWGKILRLTFRDSFYVKVSMYLDDTNS